MSDLFCMSALDILCSYTGVCFSAEHRCMLNTSIQLLQHDYKANEAKFLGKISGIDNDYYLVQILGDNMLTDMKYFYSTDALHWGILQPCQESKKKELGQLRGYFTGDPAHSYEKPTEGEDLQNRHHRNSVLKEEDRLAYMVHRIFRETAIVPRKGVMYLPEGLVVKNPSFQGLSHAQASDFSSYLHMRLPSEEYSSNNSAADADLAFDFLEPLAHQGCSSCWTMTSCEAGNVVVLRNIQWPGSLFYHRVNTAEHGFFYVGWGQENLDVPFMIPSAPTAAQPDTIQELENVGNEKMQVDNETAITGQA